MSKRVLLKLFIEEKNINKAINIMTLAGISGFFLHNYRGISSDKFKTLKKEDLEDINKVYEIINKESDKAVIIGTVVKEEKSKKIEELLKEKMSNDKWTLIKIPILKVKVHKV
ncbi:Exonuclease SbcC [Methanocaldococcus lauensis]|nr:Exonuclease SbcC [Methanocaldococcus lauensis]